MHEDSQGMIGARADALLMLCWIRGARRVPAERLCRKGEGLTAPREEIDSAARIAARQSFRLAQRRGNETELASFSAEDSRSMN